MAPPQERTDTERIVGVDATWELDFWGRFRRSIEAADALAEAVWAAAQDPSRSFRLLYPDEAPLGEKILTIVKEIYGGDGIEHVTGDLLNDIREAISRRE